MAKLPFATLDQVQAVCPGPCAAGQAGPDGLCPACLALLPAEAQQALAAHRDSQPAERSAALVEAVRGIALLADDDTNPDLDEDMRPHARALTAVLVAHAIQFPWKAQTLRTGWSLFNQSALSAGLAEG